MKIGSLCTGYGGLDMALDGTTAWVSDIDRHARTLLAYRFPDTPNLGDLTAVDWASVEPVDIITAGYPCQPFSHAGKRDGTDDDRHIWPHIAAAVRVLRPRFVFLENVAGHLSLGFGDVLGDLAALGFNADWVSVRASDVGAPHRRERVFILATDAERGASGLGYVAHVLGRRAGEAEQARLGGGITPDPEGNEQREQTDGGEVRSESRYDASRDRPTPVHSRTDWGDYGPAIARWEHLTGRYAPNATEPNSRGKQRLSPRFVEWLMGLPGGWVTDVPGLSRTKQLELLGNGVVPQQARAALAVIA